MGSIIPNLRHLRAFREVARCGGISQAAKRIYLSQPAITQALARLETLLQSTLFERRSDGTVPTAAGNLFLRRVERLLAFLDQGAREAARAGLRKSTRRREALDHLFTTTQLRALIAVADARNFSLAARAVGISQPSLHRAARDLERLIEIALFEKANQGVGLTRAGAVLAQHAKLAFAELEQGIAEMMVLRGVDTGRITIGSMPLARSSILPAAINALLRGRPDLNVSVVDGPYADLLSGLRHGDLDFLIGALREQVPGDVRQEALFDDPLVVAARTGHPLAARHRLSVPELAAFPWVTPRPGTPTRDHFDALMHDLHPPSIVQASSLVLIRGLLLDSDRLTLISAHQIEHECRLGVLTPLAVEMAPSRRPIGLTLRRDWHPTAAQHALLGLLRHGGRACAGAGRIAAASVP